MIALSGVVKRYDGRPVVDVDTLELAAGATTVLIGPSGCGKSTLLRLLVGLVTADRGEVRVDDAPVDPATVQQLRRRIGYVIQDGGLFPHLTAERNVTLMARHLGWSDERCAARVGELGELVRLPAECLGRYPLQLSGGQRQRVALMRGLALDPEVLLLDEPLGALDPMIRAELQYDLRDIFRSLGKTVVLVTHDLGEAGFLGDRIVLMREGRVVQAGSFEDLVRRPADDFVRSFVRAQRSPLDALSDEAATADAASETARRAPPEGTR